MRARGLSDRSGLRPTGADREPTDDEAAAEQNDLDPGVAEHEREMAERGARQNGEARIA